MLKHGNLFENKRLTVFGDQTADYRKILGLEQQMLSERQAVV